MADPAVQSRLNDNLRLARELGIDGTPAPDLAELKTAITAARLHAAAAGPENSARR